MKEMTWIQAMRDFFGLLNGSNLQGFMDEIKQLTPEDREEFKQGLEQNGYKIK